MCVSVCVCVCVEKSYVEQAVYVGLLALTTRSPYDLFGEVVTYGRGKREVWGSTRPVGTVSRYWCPKGDHQRAIVSVQVWKEDGTVCTRVVLWSHKTCDQGGS